ncbi:hypothetical protein [Desulfolutivibrio sulfoxidireducens]|uniref:hypothetical protein n=1 Tax=Desulfolutivibrio sulfoxidireducens TaxID=2773299 RepID=UPI00159D8DB6|nr:hypothetical protein [Desulfolutivibrio sulfoxidireducens]QLA20602.1 hypothetical protein GD604_13230 [Desulfolutivibrio sulfoxidireducens]
MARFAAVIVFLMVITGCASMKVRQNGAIDPNEKTINVPPGGGFAGKVKDALTGRGWKTFVATDLSQSRALGGDVESVQVSRNNRGRYTLFVNSSVYDLCLDGTDAVSYDISIVDSKEGIEIFTASGRGCENAVIKKLIEKSEGKI